MIHTRTLSVSDRSSVPTQPLCCRLSRSNSAVISAGHSLRSAAAAVWSSMLRAMAFLQRLAAQYKRFLGWQEMAGTVSGGRAKRAIVTGGSMSGVFAGLQVRKLGFDVDVY